MTPFAAFICLSGFGALSTSKLRISFDVIDMVPEDSYVKSYTYALKNYFQQGPYDCTVIFRGLDFSNNNTQSYMRKYLQEIVALPFVSKGQPASFWLDDLEAFVRRRKLEALSFVEQLDLFLQNALYSKIYNQTMIRSKNGDVLASAVSLSLDIELGDTVQQVAFLSLQEMITEKTDVNHSKKLNYFFTFSPHYFVWEFFRQSLNELILSTITGLVAVFGITFIFVQNPIASIFVTSTVAMVYIDVLGIIQFVGLAINPVTYVSIILSIGLVVDYGMFGICFAIYLI